MINLQIRYLVAGLFMGVAELIPGISGSTVAVIFKIYKKLKIHLDLIAKEAVKRSSFGEETKRANLSFGLV